MKVLKVLGKILAVLLAVVLFCLELTFQVIKPISSTISNPKEIINNIEISELFNGDTQEYDNFVENISKQIGVTVDQAKGVIESKAVKGAIGEVMQSVIEVATGNEDAKLSKEEVKDLVNETIDALKEEMDVNLPEDIEKQVEQIVNQFNLDDLYKQLEGLITNGQPVNYVTNQPVLSTKQMSGVIVRNEMSLVDIIGLVTKGTIEIGLLIAIIVVVGLIFLFQFSISGGLIETGIVSILAGIPMLFVERLNDTIIGMLGQLDGKILAIINAFDFHVYTTNAIIFIIVGVVLLAGGIVIANIRKNKKAKADESVKVEENTNKDE